MERSIGVCRTQGRLTTGMAFRAAWRGVACLLLAACTEASAVEWGAIEQASGEGARRAAGDAPLGGPRADGAPGRFDFDADGACPASLRFSRGPRDEVHAVWWEARADSSAALRAARSDDGGARWGAPVPVDTVDRGRLGCRRPPPGITVDSVLGYVHVVYYLEGPEGAGIFFAHSMERGAVYHAPIAIMYGERPSSAAVAARAGIVAVAFEEPNAARPEVWFTLSSTAGHIFGPRSRLSGTSVAATRPRITLAGSAVIVEWMEAAHRGGAGLEAPPVRVVSRTGRLPRGTSSTIAP